LPENLKNFLKIKKKKLELGPAQGAYKASRDDEVL
jgi:hypothetical protein